MPLGQPDSLIYALLIPIYFMGITVRKLNVTKGAIGFSHIQTLVIKNQTEEEQAATQ